MLMLIPMPKIVSADLLKEYVDARFLDVVIADVSQEKATHCRLVHRCRFCMKGLDVTCSDL